jgi:hypothetical protein
MFAIEVAAVAGTDRSVEPTRVQKSNDVIADGAR